MLGWARIWVGLSATIAARRRLADEGGAAAVEFAMIVPVFLFLIHGIICLSAITTVYSSVQQIAAEAARASVAGVTTRERETLARDYVSANAASFAFIDPQKIALRTASLDSAFAVTVHYDMSDLFVYRIGAWMTLPSTGVDRTSIVRFGGY